MKNKFKKAYFAGGCFWGVEFYFQKMTGVVSTAVGYMGGHTKNPRYEDVCFENTGHAETVEVVFDDSKVSFEDLAKLFFEIHDSTQVDRQGPDIGDQYRSTVFYVNPEQRKTVQKQMAILEEKGFKITTLLVKAGVFYPAEEYHQNYFLKNNGQPYCHFRQKRF